MRNRILEVRERHWKLAVQERQPLPILMIQGLSDSCLHCE